MARVLAAVLIGSLLLAPGRASAADVRIESLNGGVVDPFAAPAGTNAIVFLFTSTDCPDLESLCAGGAAPGDDVRAAGRCCSG